MAWRSRMQAKLAHSIRCGSGSTPSGMSKRENIRVTGRVAAPRISSLTGVGNRKWLIWGVPSSNSSRGVKSPASGGAALAASSILARKPGRSTESEFRSR